MFRVFSCFSWKEARQSKEMTSQCDRLLPSGFMYPLKIWNSVFLQRRNTFYFIRPQSFLAEGITSCMLRQDVCPSPEIKMHPSASRGIGQLQTSQKWNRKTLIAGRTDRTLLDWQTRKMGTKRFSDSGCPAGDTGNSWYDYRSCHDWFHWGWNCLTIFECEPLL